MARRLFPHEMSGSSNNILSNSYLNIPEDINDLSKTESFFDYCLSSLNFNLNNKNNAINNSFFLNFIEETKNKLLSLLLSSSSSSSSSSSPYLSQTNDNNNNIIYYSNFYFFIKCITLFFILLIFKILYNHKQLEKNIIKETNNIPTKNFYKILPIIGDLSMVLDPLNYQPDHHTLYGNIFATMFMNEPYIVLTSHHLIEQIFYNNAKSIKMEWTKNFKELLFGPYSILSVHGQEHKKQRKIIINSLGIPALNKLFPKMVNVLQLHVNSWIKESSSSSTSSPSDINYIDMVPRIENAIWDAMSLVVFGDDFPSDISKELSKLMGIIGNGLFAIPFELPFSALKNGKNARKQFEKILINEYNRRINTLPEGGFYRDDFFQSIINETKHDENLEYGFNIDLAITAIYGALDTTKSTSLHMIDTMIDHGDEWNYINNLVISKFGKDGIKSSDVNFSLIEKEIPYISSCLKEILRYNGVGVMSMRKVIDDIEINDNITGKKYLIPKDYKICISHYFNGINPESKIFSHPTTFKPKRFLIYDDDDVASDNNNNSNNNNNDAVEESKLIEKTKCSTSSFGGGERVCPGNPVAKMEIIILMILMSDFTWIRKSKVKKWNATPFPIPEGGLWVRAISNNKNKI